MIIFYLWPIGVAIFSTILMQGDSLTFSINLCLAALGTLLGVIVGRKYERH